MFSWPTVLAKTEQDGVMGMVQENGEANGNRALAYSPHNNILSRRSLFLSSYEFYFHSGNYSMLKSDFTFKRRTGHAILQIYIPTIALVCVSWISLWIDQDSTAARVGMSASKSSFNSLLELRRNC